MRKRAGQRGMTLLELLVTIGLVGMLSGLAGTSAYQVVRMTARGTDELSAIHDLRNAGQWIVLDGQRAYTLDLVDGAAPATSMTLRWIADDSDHTAIYSLSGTELRRNYDGTVMVVAHHVSSVGFSVNQRLLRASVVSSPSASTSKQLTYEVYLRPYW